MNVLVSLFFGFYIISRIIKFINKQLLNDYGRQSYVYNFQIDIDLIIKNERKKFCILVSIYCLGFLYDGKYKWV